jgi:phospholipid/cholesterol/gamma-HCH transport system substrate-binding protein
MPQHKQLTWNELRVGLFVLVGLLILAVGIFYVTAPGFLGPKYRIITYLPEASGLADGAPVRIDGVEVGNVETKRLVPQSTTHPVDKNKNIEIVLRVDKRFQNYVLTDSVASVVTAGLLGDKYVNVTRGFSGAIINDGQEIQGVEEKDVKEVMARSSEVLVSLQQVSKTVQSLLDGIQKGQGSLGKLLRDETAYNNLNSLLANGNKLVTDIQAGQGTVGKLFTSDEIYNKANTAIDNLNGIVTDVRAGKGSLGKLLYDPSLYDEAKRALANGNSMIDDARAGKGSLGKFITDDTLYNKLRDTSSNLAKASEKLNDNTTTVGKLFSDPQLYDNLAGLTGDLRLFIGDFRQNPKKFLHIKITVF